jgi:dihydroneopterin triphosphate diphosphatase
MSVAYKQPVSVLVVIHTPDLQVLLIERAAHPGYWQSVTGSREGGESLPQTACREVGEETGLQIEVDALRDWQQCNRYEIYPQWRHRYAPGVTHNEEHVFSLEVPAARPVQLAPDEHRAQCWLPWQKAAEHCFSPSNRTAILELPQRLGLAPGTAER